MCAGSYAAHPPQNRRHVGGALELVGELSLSVDSGLGHCHYFGRPVVPLTVTSCRWSAFANFDVSTGGPAGPGGPGGPGCPGKALAAAQVRRLLRRVFS